jgi:hypothetical protein
MTSNRSGDGTGLALDRRSVLRTLGGTGALVALGSGAATRGAAAQEGGYSVVQDGECTPVTPLSGDRTVEELYDLRIPDEYEGQNGATDPGEGPYYGAVGAQDLQRTNTTVSFLYDGPEGLSLVVIHGALDDDDGDGARGISWRLEGEVLSDGEWVVRDDFYLDPDTGEPAESNFDRWEVSGETHTIDWTYGGGRTDGGAFRPLGEEFTVSIDPRYNEEAALWDEAFYDGEVTDWEFLSFPDGRDDPERLSLELDEELRLRSVSCDGDDDDDDDSDGDDEDDEESEGIEVTFIVPGKINTRSRGLATVFLFGDTDLDTGDVDVDSLRFGPPSVVDDGGGASPEHDGHGGGGAPLILHFPVQDTGFEPGDDTAKLVGETNDGTALTGTKGVRVTPSDDDDDDDDHDDDDDDHDGEDREERNEQRSDENDSTDD